MDYKSEHPSYYQTLEATQIFRNGSHSLEESDVLRERTVEVLINDVYAIRITCTPSHLRELVMGRLFTEGFIVRIEDVESIVIAEDLTQVKVFLVRDDKPQRCALVEEVPTVGGGSEVIRRYAIPEATFSPYKSKLWDADEIFRLSDIFAYDTPLHSRTSGTHSCYLAAAGEVVFCAEDIGRHNALDKVIGYALMNSLDFSQITVFTSGRIPVDMVAKALRAKIPVIASKAAPTAQAIMLARKYGLTLVCLVKGNQISVFSGIEREKSVSFGNPEFVGRETVVKNGE